MIDRIEFYQDTMKVILKPTAKFQAGSNYFYCDTEDIDLVRKYTWNLVANRNNIYVSCAEQLKLHRELALKYMGEYPPFVDHINGVDIDNVDINLNPVTRQQNKYNNPVKGYSYRASNKDFAPQVRYNRKVERPYGVVHTEIEACELAYIAETDYLKFKMGDEYYMYDFLKDRRNDLDILDLERTKKITPEEATYRHVIRYAKDNAWYYYRYALADYFKENHIPIPDYNLDADGFMTHPITGQKLCPYVQ